MSHIGFFRSALGLVKKKRIDYVSQYLQCFNSIEKLISDKKLTIDIAKKIVVLDVSVHLLFMDNDKKYSSFMDKVRMYINYRYCSLNKSSSEYIKHDDRINFYVILKLLRFVDSDGDPIDGGKEDIDTLLVGIFQNGEIKYVPYKEKY